MLKYDIKSKLPIPSLSNGFVHCSVNNVINPSGILKSNFNGIFTGAGFMATTAVWLNFSPLLVNGIPTSSYSDFIFWTLDDVVENASSKVGR